MSNIHPTAQVEAGARVDPTARVWHFCHLRDGSVLEALVSIGRDGYVDKGVTVSRGTRVQNGVSLYVGLEIGQWCFIGPHSIFTNDPYPRSGKRDWELRQTILRNGVSIGAGCVIRCGVTLGAFCMAGAGAIVTKDIPAFHLATGTPAEPKKMICACGDQRFPLGTGAAKLVGDCCRRKLEPEVLRLAEKEQEALLQEAP